MSSNQSSDAELLGEWVEIKSERAFQELVSRYAGLVHAAAKRTCGDDSMASEASQLVFILLARKGGSLLSRESLAGWLHSAAMMQTKNLQRGSRREHAKRKELHLAMEQTPNDPGNELWDEVKPFVDDALASLPEKDREALLMYFYRSLTAREIASALGIATAAAKKRIERAMEKLRTKLAARGVELGGSFSSVMFAGFAADVEAAGLPVKLMAAKAMAAGSGGGAGLSAGTISLMKASSFVPPVLALVVAGFWIGPKREAVASVERKLQALKVEDAGKDGVVQVAERRERAKEAGEVNGAKRKEIDWEAVALAEENERNSGRTRNFRGVEEMLLDTRLDSMTPDELLAELVRVDALDLSVDSKETLESRLHHILARRDPKFALEHLERWLGVKESAGFALTSALREYAKKHPSEAIAWLDRQIAEGRLEVKRLDGRNWSRDRLEGALVQAGMIAFPGLLVERLGKMAPKDRLAVMGSLTPRMPKQEQVAYANLVRQTLDDEGRLKMIAGQGLVFNEDYKWVDDYLGRIEATADERARTYERATKYSLMNPGFSQKLTSRQVEKAWEWSGVRIPEARDRLIGEALGFAWRDDGPMGFEDAARLAVEFNARGENDQVIVAFLRSKGAMMKKERSRQIAEMISDEGVKADVLRVLK